MGDEGLTLLPCSNSSFSAARTSTWTGRDDHHQSDACEGVIIDLPNGWHTSMDWTQITATTNSTVCIILVDSARRSCCLAEREHFSVMLLCTDPISSERTENWYWRAVVSLRIQPYSRRIISCTTTTPETTETTFQRKEEEIQNRGWGGKNVFCADCRETTGCCCCCSSIRVISYICMFFSASPVLLLMYNDVSPVKCSNRTWTWYKYRALEKVSYRKRNQ